MKPTHCRPPSRLDGRAFVLAALLAPPLFLSSLFGTSGCDWGAESPSLDAAGDAAPDGSEDAESFSPREVGVTCNARGECVENASCIGNPFDDYQCMRHCDEHWTLCPDGSVCTPTASGDPICYTGGAARYGEQCQSNLHCSSGLLCIGLEVEQCGQNCFCLEACHTGQGGCADDEFCKAFGGSGKGYCRSRVGARCNTSADCRDDLTCSTEFDAPIPSQFPGGYCSTSECEDDSDCPSDAKCRTYPETEISVCLATCAMEPDCRLTDNYTCLTESHCEQTANPADCKGFRDGANLCVPPALTTWTEN